MPASNCSRLLLVQLTVPLGKIKSEVGKDRKIISKCEIALRTLSLSLSLSLSLCLSLSLPNHSILLYYYKRLALLSLLLYVHEWTRLSFLFLSFSLSTPFFVTS